MSRPRAGIAFVAILALVAVACSGGKQTAQQAPIPGETSGPAPPVTAPTAAGTAPGVPATVAPGATTSLPGTALPAPAAGACEAGPGPYQQGLTATTIKVGIIEPLSGPLSFIGRPWIDAVRAVYSQVNDAGGICGRKIVWEIRDDKFDNQLGAEKCRELVADAKVWALVTSWSVFTVDACIPFLESKKMHWFLTDGASDAQYKSPYIFPYGVVCRNLGHHIAVHMFRDKGVKRAGMIYINNDVGRACQQATFDAAKETGGQVAIDRSVEFTDGVLRYQAILAEMQSANVDAIIIHGSPVETINTIKAAKNNGDYKPPKGYFTGGGAALDITIINTRGCCANLIESVVSNAPFPTASTDTPAIRKMVGTIRKYYPNADLGTFAVGGYLQATTLVAALRQVGGDLTRARLAAVLSGGTWCSGIGPCVEYSPPRFKGGNGRPINEFMLYQVKKLRWTVISDFQKDNY